MPAKKKLFKVKPGKGPLVNDAKGVQESFSYILKMVEDGWTIREACALSSVSSTALYKHITEQQKIILKAAKLAHSQVGSYIKMSVKKKEESTIPKELKDDNDFKDLIIESPNIDWDWND